MTVTTIWVVSPNDGNLGCWAHPAKNYSAEDLAKELKDGESKYFLVRAEGLEDASERGAEVATDGGWVHDRYRSHPVWAPIADLEGKSAACHQCMQQGLQAGHSACENFPEETIRRFYKEGYVTVGYVDQGWEFGVAPPGRRYINAAGWLDPEGGEDDLRGEGDCTPQETGTDRRSPTGDD